MMGSQSERESVLEAARMRLGYGNALARVGPAREEKKMVLTACGRTEANKAFLSASVQYHGQKCVGCDGCTMDVSCGREYSLENFEANVN